MIKVSCFQPGLATRDDIESHGTLQTQSKSDVPLFFYRLGSFRSNAGTNRIAAIGWTGEILLEKPINNCRRDAETCRTSLLPSFSLDQQGSYTTILPQAFIIPYHFPHQLYSFRLSLYRPPPPNTSQWPRTASPTVRSPSRGITASATSRLTTAYADIYI